MAHECFEDEEVAGLLNEAFVSVKVDREEMPEIDNAYMSVCMLLTGSGGWPLTIVMTPDKKPFYAGTYFPKRSGYGRPGMMELVPALKDFWDNKREDALDASRNIMTALQESQDIGKGEILGEETLKEAYNQFRHIFDEKYGGFGDRPKFPSPHSLMFLLRYWKRTGNKKALEMVIKTLDKMALGGVFDHVGFGFHRYSTDSKWLLPHYEKMLYDQALISMAYTEVYQATEEKEYKKMSERIFEYVLRDMTSEEGAFFSAEDADSEDEEGKFYVWSLEEVNSVLDREEAGLAEMGFNIKEEGNFLNEATRKKTGFNILHLTRPIPELCSELDMPDLGDRLEGIRKKLFDAREKRVRPGRDDKILVDWNSLMISALSKASGAFSDEKYSRAAKKAADFILQSIDKNNGILHSFRDGEWRTKGNIDDHAFLVNALIDLYEATFEVRYLKKALELNEKCIRDFWDEKEGGFYFISKDAETIIVRQKEIYDGAVPSGNSVALLNLIRLGRITGETRLEEKAKELVKAFSGTVSKAPHGYSQMLMGLDFFTGHTFEIVIAGNPTETDTHNMVNKLREKFIPNKIIILNPVNETSSEIHEISKYVKNQEMVNEKATAYVCADFTCSEPTTDINEMLGKLQ